MIEKALRKARGAPITTAEMETLTELRAPNEEISDLRGLEAATNLLRLYLGEQYVAVEGRDINSNDISDLSPLSDLTALTLLDLEGNNISDISPLSGLTNLVVLRLAKNNISDISPLSGLTNLFFVGLWDNLISDISPLEANAGFGQGEEVNVGENPLSPTSINVYIPALESRRVEVHASDLKQALTKYVLSMSRDLNLIHIPLEVITVDGVTKSIESIGDLYDALGGSGVVNFIVTHDPDTQEWFGYFGDADRGTPLDRVLTDSMGILVGMLAPAAIVLNGSPLGSEGRSTISFHPNLNLVGLPLRDERIDRVSDLLTLDGLEGNALAVISTQEGEFKLVARPGDPGDIPVIGGQSFIVIAQRAVTVPISGEGWYNTVR